jgi:hypothetical protein
MSSPHDRCRPGWPPLRPDLPPEDYEHARNCKHDGAPYPPGWIDWTGYARHTWHRYSVAYHTGWCSPVPPTVRAAAAAVLRDPADSVSWNDFVEVLDAASREKSPHFARRAEPAMTSQNTDKLTLLMYYTRGCVGSTTGRVPTRLAANPGAVSVLENVARMVRVAGSRRDLPTAEWADRCGVSPAQLSKILTSYAEWCGWTVRRYRTGHDKTNMIEIST